jgi:NAD(P)-dependent dehydrogenase (short-subunit alcohol dehydrogenase family)
MEGKVIVTGSRGNLGEAVTRKFLSAGKKVIATVEPGKSTESNYDNVQYYGVNLLEESAVNDWAENIVSKSGKIDSLVCLVGGFGMSNLLDTEVDDIHKMVRLNFFTAYHTVRAVLRNISKDNGPINIVLMGAKPAVEKHGSKGVFPYALSKTMVVELAEAINAEQDELNAQASVIVPSIIDTPPNREAMPDANFDDWVTPESIADKIVFLCSDAGKDLRDTVFKVYGNS